LTGLVKALRLAGVDTSNMSVEQLILEGNKLKDENPVVKKAICKLKDQRSYRRNSVGNESTVTEYKMHMFCADLLYNDTLRLEHACGAPINTIRYAQGSNINYTACVENLSQNASLEEERVYCNELVNAHERENIPFEHCSQFYWGIRYSGQ